MTPHDARRPSREFPNKRQNLVAAVLSPETPRLRPRRRQVLGGLPYYRRRGGGVMAGLAVVRESGAGDEVIMSIAGHVSHAMLSRCSHVRMEAKRLALDGIATRQREADEKRQEDAKQQDAVVLQSQLVQ